MIKKRFTLQISFLSIYALTFIILMSTLIAVGSFTFLRTISLVAKALLNDVSQLVAKDMKEKGVAPETLARLTKELLEYEDIDDQRMINYCLFIAKNTTRFQLAHPTRLISWMSAKGHSIITYLEPDGTYSTAVITPSFQRRYFRDKSGKIIRTTKAAYFDYRTTPSYRLAKKIKQFIWTDAFLSYPHRNMTTAAITPIYNKEGRFLGVFAIDIKMEGVSVFLESLTIGKHGIVFLINKKNHLIAFPGMKQWMNEQTKKEHFIPLNYLGKPWAEAAVAQYEKNPQIDFTYQYDNKQYLAKVYPLPEEIPEVAAYDWKIVVVVPQSDFTSDLERKNIMVTLIGIAILLFGLLLAAYLSKMITTRLKLLVSDTEKIKDFQLEGDKIHSAIKEVDVLASAIYSMKINLRSFQKYMPAKLVRQLIATGEDAQLGGEKKKLSILFSDIKNFTHISESMETSDLMSQLSEYLDNLSHLITQSNGTIDKFIGDSIMAFWGAPLQDEFHWEHACRTALACKDKLNSLNAQWQAQGKQPFITRFGIHTGEVLVGNIGSTERMNYTALGDSVNFTSRLEQMNKVYGTTIISSEEIVIQAQEQFIFRILDKTSIRGKSGSYTVYELLAERGSPLSFDLQTYQSAFNEGFAAYQKQAWQEAILSFHKALLVYPEDRLAPVFLTRCNNFMHSPPPTSWDGVWRE